jgi:hypothetical protein
MCPTGIEIALLQHDQVRAGAAQKINDPAQSKAAIDVPIDNAD